MIIKIYLTDNCVRTCEFIRIHFIENALVVQLRDNTLESFSLKRIEGFRIGEICDFPRDKIIIDKSKEGDK